MSRDRTTHGPKRFAELAAPVSERAFRRRGFTESAVVTRWPRIVGEALAAQTLPEKLVRRKGETPDAPGEGVLHVRVGSGALALELQHLEPQLVERINGFFGYRAVDRIRVTQGRLPPREKREYKTPRPLSTAEETALETETAGVESDALRDALKRLGREVKRGPS